uniref:Ribosomal RNA-processing protein 43 n=1 Tax=Plectus sambesii TaxID=2011161 RepID=A0A914WG18_9BILA
MASPADLLRVCDPGEYYRSFLERDLLPDGRATSEFRPLSLQLGVISSAYGSAMVRQGGACVVVSVQPEVSVPIDGSGFIVVNVDSSLDATDASLSMQAQLEDTVACLHSLIDDDAIVNRKSLVVVAEKIAWTLYVEVLVLSVDGGLTDATVSALVGALADLRLPSISLKDEATDDDRPFELSKAALVISDARHRLELVDYPVSSTFVFHKATCADGDAKKRKRAVMRCICDPSEQLLALMTGACNVVVGRQGQVYRVNRGGGGEGVSISTLDTVVSLAAKRQQSVELVIEQALRMRAD